MSKTAVFVQLNGAYEIVKDRLKVAVPSQQVVGGGVNVEVGQTVLGPTPTLIPQKFLKCPAVPAWLF